MRTPGHGYLFSCDFSTVHGVTQWAVHGGAEHCGERDGEGAVAVESDIRREEREASDGDDGRRTAGAARAVPDGEVWVPGHPLVWADGDVRPGHGVHVEARVGRVAGSRARGNQVSIGAPPPGAGDGHQGPGHDEHAHRRVHHGGGLVSG